MQKRKHTKNIKITIQIPVTLSASSVSIVDDLVKELKTMVQKYSIDDGDNSGYVKIDPSSVTRSSTRIKWLEEMNKSRISDYRSKIRVFKPDKNKPKERRKVEVSSLGPLADAIHKIGEERRASRSL